METFVDTARTEGMFSWDVEHNPELSVHGSHFELLGISFAAGDLCFYETDISKAFGYLKTLFAEDIEAIAWNGKYDIKCIHAAGFSDYPLRFVDPMVGLNLLDDNLSPHDLGLKPATLAVFGYQMATFQEAMEAGMHSPEFAKYASDDAYWELKHWKRMRPLLEEQELLKLFERVLMPAALVFADMERVGIGWDLDGARKLLRGFQELRTKKEEEIWAEIGELNIDSGDQIARRLFDELGYSTANIEMTASGRRWSVNTQAMNTLASKYPVCEKIRTYRTATKMINTYIEPLTRMHLEDPQGRVHPTYWLVSATGRTRCEKPNFQNIPKWLTKRKEFKHLSLRKNVVAQEGRKLIIADFSQIELRLVAHITQDEKFVRAYTSWNCKICGEAGEQSTILHTCPKCGVFEDEQGGFWHGEDLHQQTTDIVPALNGDRQQGKTANFALVYFATAFKLAHEYPIFNKREWQTVIDQYFDRDSGYRGVHEWHVRMQDQLWRTGECVDIFGRRRRIPFSQVKRTTKHALNQIINFAPQASACGMMLLAMAKMREDFIDRGWWMSGVLPTNMVHDEIILEVHPDLVEESIKVTRMHMENCVKLRVPVRADIGISDRWVEEDD